MHEYENQQEGKYHGCRGNIWEKLAACAGLGNLSGFGFSIASLASMDGCFANIAASFANIAAAFGNLFPCIAHTPHPQDKFLQKFVCYCK
ncbi:MAG: hypothetical protein WCY41_03735 [Candidatus Micrarchaeia archaeon]